MATATILAIFSEADGLILPLKEVVQDLFKTRDVSPSTPPPPFKCVPVFTQVEGLDKLHDHTKMLVAEVNRLLSIKLKNATEFNDLRAIFKVDASHLAKSKPDAEVPNHAIFYEKDEKYFQLSDKEPPAEVVNKVEEWIRTKFMPNTEVRSLTGLDDRKTVTSLLQFTSTQVAGLSRILVDNVKEERTVLNLGVIEYPSVESQYFRLYKIDLKAWVKKSSLGGGVIANKREWGLRGEFNAYGFERSDEENYIDLNDNVKGKMIQSFDNFASGLAPKVKEPAIKPPGCDGCAETLNACKAHAEAAIDEINASY